MIYPIKTLSQLPFILKGFRKEKELTQAAMAERLGITQQSYAHFEAHPASATLDRIFMVLRMLDVEISLNQISPSQISPSQISPSQTSSASRKETTPTAKAIQKISKPPAAEKADRIAAPTRKKESW